MQVNAINFSGRSDNLNAFMNLEDDTLKQIAYADTMANVNMKKHKRQQVALDMMLPLAGGLSAAAIALKGSRLRAFGGATATWALFLAGIGAVFGAEKFAKQHSEKFDNFTEKHPFLTAVSSIVFAFVAGRYAVKGGTKLGKMIAETPVFKSGLVKAKELVNKAKDVKVLKNIDTKVADFLKNTPQSLKEVGKVAATWAPWAVICGQIGHSVNYNKAINDRYNETYSALKDAQISAIKKHSRDLELQNDFLMTNKDNIDDVEELNSLI